MVPRQEQSLKLNEFLYEFNLLFVLVFHSGGQQPHNAHPLQIYTNQMEAPFGLRKLLTAVPVLPETEGGSEKTRRCFFSPFLCFTSGGIFLRRRWAMRRREKKIIWKLRGLAKYTGESKRKGLNALLPLSRKAAEDRQFLKNAMLLWHPSSLWRLAHTS